MAPIVILYALMSTETEVRSYWEQRTCGTVHATSRPMSKEYFDEIEQARYSLEPHIPGCAEFERWKGQRVLEIGVGAGTDFVNFARNGAELIGIDLTEAGIEHARHRLELEGLSADLRVASGEELPFEDNSVDLVYSWGVIHHAQSPETVVREIRRVLRPGGQVTAMLYGRHSWEAYKRWTWGLAVALKRGEKLKSLSGAIASYMESPGTQCYTRRELTILFGAAGFRHVDVTGILTVYDERYIKALARRVPLCWNLVVTAT
jgi:ubiquinone/menaquinone biosynthesis C-methylase UbiE